MSVSSYFYKNKETSLDHPPLKLLLLPMKIWFLVVVFSLLLSIFNLKRKMPKILSSSKSATKAKL